jgi:hypothetical protein
MSNRICFLILIIILYAPSALPGNQSEPVVKPAPGISRRWTIGAGFGPDFYYGDLNRYKFGVSNNLSLAGNLSFQYQFGNVIGTRLKISGAWLNGSGSITTEGKTEEVPFTGVLLQGDLSAVINFSNLFSPDHPHRWFFIYATVGIGYGGWYTKLINKVYNAGNIETDNPLSNFRTAIVIPAGPGFLFRAGDRVNISLEYTFNTFSSDWLDQTEGGKPFDRYDCLALGISINLGKSRGRKQQVSDYSIKDYLVEAPRPAVYQSLPSGPVVVNLPVQEPGVPVPTQEEEFSYGVQIFAFSHHRYTPDWIRKHYRIPVPVRAEKEGNTERFIAGGMTDLPSARRLCDEMKQLGIRDAFVVAYKDGKRHHPFNR